MPGRVSVQILLYLCPKLIELAHVWMRLEMPVAISRFIVRFYGLGQLIVVGAHRTKLQLMRWSKKFKYVMFDVFV